MIYSLVVTVANDISIFIADFNRSVITILGATVPYAIDLRPNIAAIASRA